MRSQPVSGDTLVVAEESFCDSMREVWQQRRSVRQGPAPRLWFIAPKDGCINELLKACVCLPPTPGSDRRLSHGPKDDVLAEWPLSLWPVFDEIIVQRDWSVNPDDKACPWIKEDWWQGKEWSHLRSVEDAPAVVPAGLLLLHLVRHELSTPESVWMSTLTDGTHDDVSRGTKKALDTNGRIETESLLEISERWLATGGPSSTQPFQRRQVQGTEAQRSGQQNLSLSLGFMKTALTRRIWKTLWGAPVQGNSDLDRPIVVYCDDSLENLKMFAHAAGPPIVPVDNAKATPTNDRPGANPPQYLLLGGSDMQTRDPKSLAPKFLGTRRDRWDEEIFKEICSAAESSENHQATSKRPAAKRPVFIICDYDLDCDRHIDTQTAIRNASLTGAKLAALVKAHLVNDPSFGNSIVSAIAFTGGRSPIIAQECLTNGCDFVIAKGVIRGDLQNAAHVSADVEGLCSLSFWIWTLACHSREIQRVCYEIQRGPSDKPITDSVRDVCRCAIRRGVALPKSLEPAMNDLRYQAYRSMGSDHRPTHGGSHP
jgi:hypothetical protein